MEHAAFSHVDYVNAWDDGGQFEALIGDCRIVARELIERYHLRGKKIVSVGAGAAHEEIGFILEGNCRLTCFDIDEHDTIKPRAMALEPRDPEAPGTINYYFGDFLDWRPDTEDSRQFDVLYFSGFTPDELRRDEIKTAHIALTYQGRVVRALKYVYAVLQHQLYRLGHGGNSSLDIADPAWPRNTAPLHPIVAAAAKHLIAPDGYLILQSYCGGIDVVSNPGFVKQMNEQLDSLSLCMLEAYHFAAAPAVTLFVAQKIGDGLKASQSRLKTMPNLTRFHGRAQLPDKSIVRFIKPSGD